MTDEDWGDIDSAPDSDRSTPRWLWFCGCGCLVMVLAMVGAFFGLKQIAVESADVDLQWTRLAEILECEQPADGNRLVVGFEIPFVDVSIFVFEPDGDELGGVLFSIPAGEDGDEFRQELLNQDGEMNGEPFTILVQGREVNGMRDVDQSKGSGFRFSGNKHQDAAHTMILDLTDDGPVNVMLMLFSEDHELEEISERSVRAFLKPFKIGPDWPVPDEVEVPSEEGAAEEFSPEAVEEIPAEAAEESSEEPKSGD